MSNYRPRMTRQTLMVLGEFLKDPDAELYGRIIRKQTGLHPGTIYPILGRLESAGLLRSRWEPPVSGIFPGRPPRHYYTLTSEGWAVARQEAVLARSSR